MFYGVLLMHDFVYDSSVSLLLINYGSLAEVCSFGSHSGSDFVGHVS